MAILKLVFISKYHFLFHPVSSHFCHVPIEFMKYILGIEGNKVKLNVIKVRYEILSFWFAYNKIFAVKNTRDIIIKKYKIFNIIIYSDFIFFISAPKEYFV